MFAKGLNWLLAAALSFSFVQTSFALPMIKKSIHYGAARNEAQWQRFREPKGNFNREQLKVVKELLPRTTSIYVMGAGHIIGGTADTITGTSIYKIGFKKIDGTLNAVITLRQMSIPNYLQNPKPFIKPGNWITGEKEGVDMKAVFKGAKIIEKTYYKPVTAAQEALLKSGPLRLGKVIPEVAPVAVAEQPAAKLADMLK